MFMQRSTIDCLDHCSMYKLLRARMQHTFTHLHTYSQFCTHIHICTHMHAYAHLCTHMRTYAHICTHMRIYSSNSLGPLPWDRWLARATCPRLCFRATIARIAWIPFTGAGGLREPPVPHWFSSSYSSNKTFHELAP